MKKENNVKFWKPREIETIRFIEPEDKIELESFEPPTVPGQWIKSDRIGPQKIMNYSICTATGKIIVHSNETKCLICELLEKYKNNAS